MKLAICIVSLVLLLLPASLNKSYMDSWHKPKYSCVIMEAGNIQYTLNKPGGRITRNIEKEATK